MLKINVFIRWIYLLVFFVSISKSSTAQLSKNLTDRLYAGGNFGASFGLVTYVEVSPLLGYKITEKLSAGIGFTYSYLSDKRYVPTFSTSIYGGRVFGKYMVYQNFFAYSEIEGLNIDKIYSEGRTNIYNVYIGGGYQQAIGANSSFGIMLLYNLNQTASAYYYQANPVIRVGFNIGL
jgi:hypothetical protein